MKYKTNIPELKLEIKDKFLSITSSLDKQRVSTYILNTKNSIRLSSLVYSKSEILRTLNRTNIKYLLLVLKNENETIYYVYLN